jgi:chromosome segregation ATPase
LTLEKAKVLIAQLKSTIKELSKQIYESESQKDLLISELREELTWSDEKLKKESDQYESQIDKYKRQITHLTNEREELLRQTDKTKPIHDSASLLSMHNALEVMKDRLKHYSSDHPTSPSKLSDPNFLGLSI